MRERMGSIFFIESVVETPCMCANSSMLEVFSRGISLVLKIVVNSYKLIKRDFHEFVHQLHANQR